MDGLYKKKIGDSPKEDLYDKNGNQLDNNYRKVISDALEEELFDKNGNKLDGKYINTVQIYQLKIYMIKMEKSRWNI